MHLYPSETPSGPKTGFDGVVTHTPAKKGEGPAKLVCIDTVAHDARNTIKKAKVESTEKIAPEVPADEVRKPVDPFDFSQK